MIRNIIFDFGNVISPWSPRRLYDGYFGDRKKSEWFVENICPITWHCRVDRGEPVADVVAERVREFPEWRKEIEMYFEQWEKMFGPETPGIYDYIQSLKERGLHVYGLTNWSVELFPRTEKDFPAFSLLEGYVISGAEKLLKPEREIYDRLLERYHLKGEESVFLDDSPRNVEGARNAGIHAIQFTSLKETAEAVDVLIESLKQEDNKSR